MTERQEKWAMFAAAVGFSLMAAFGGKAVNEYVKQLDLEDCEPQSTTLACKQAYGLN